MNPRLSIGVLAGGKSTRMGQNKALLEFNGKRFIDSICDELSGFSQVLISAADKGIYENDRVQVVYDEHTDIGPIEGIYQVLKHADNEFVFVCAADMPFLKKELVSYMAEFISSDYDCYVIQDEDHIHPLCAIYSKRILSVIEEQIEKGQYRLMNVLNSVRTKYIHLGNSCFDKKVVKNVNTKNDYMAIKEPVVFCVSAAKNSGKTGLIEKLINEFIKEGYSVGTIKHDGHDYIMDHEGTDSYRFSKAGATYSAIFSDTQYSINHLGTTSARDLILQMRDVDVVIIEGMKNSPYPKVEVIRGEISSKPVCDVDSLICIATDVVSQDEVSCQVFDINDIPGIFLAIKERFGMKL